MGYVIEPRTATQFITDKIALPLFQRAPSWNAEQNFNLALSVFKGYPIGVVVVSSGANHTSSKVLLDGRQRRDALTQMQNPQILFDWALRALKTPRGKRLTAKNHTEEDFEEAYWITIEDFLGDQVVNDDEVDESSLDGAIDPPEDEVTGQEYVAETAPASAEDPLPVEAPKSLTIRDPEALENLLQVLLLCRGGHFTTPFDFSPFLGNTKGLKYLGQPDSVGSRLASTALCQWIRDSEFAGGVSLSPDSLLEWLIEGYSVADEAGLKAHVDREWKKIRARIEAVRGLEARLSETRIGYIEVAAPTTADEMKIFELINTSGTALTSAEVLSARADWNKPVIDAPESVANARAALYKSLKIEPHDSVIRRWDVAATVLDRLQLEWVFGGFDMSKKAAFEQKTKLGFQLYAGHYLGHIMKDDLGELGSSTAVTWDNVEFDKIILGSMTAASCVPLTQWASWAKCGFPILRAMSAAVALDFVLLAAADWQRKDFPTKGGQAKSFRRNIVVTLDRLIFEYLEGDWGHAGDSRIAKDLERLSESESALDPVPDTAWASLIERALAGEAPFNLVPRKGKTSISKEVKLLLLYFCMLRGLEAPTSVEKGYHVDHIIPESSFEASNVGGEYRNRVTNLAIVSGLFNSKKSDRPLNDLPSKDRAWLVTKIETYEQVSEKDFSKYAGPADAEALHEWRSAVWLETFGVTRKESLK